MGPGQIVVIGVAVIGFAVVSMRIARWPLTMPMVFVALGGLGAWTGLVEIRAEIEVIALFAEITLAVILFSDAVRIDLFRLRRFFAIPARLLTIGLALSIVMGTLVNRMLFPHLALAEVALIAAILSPTDAALGSAVVEDESVPARDRLVVNVESGLNDGLVVPVVAILTAFVTEESRAGVAWVGFIAQQIGWGVVVGVVAGAVAIVVLRRAHHAGWSDARYEQLATFAVPIVALFGAQALSGNPFIAAFVAGLTFGSFWTDAPSSPRPDDDGHGDHAEYFDGFTEDAAQLLALVAFFVFGNVLLADAIDFLDTPIVVCAVMALTVGRIVPVWISLLGTSLRTPTRLFIGWFGPRGLASIIFGLLLLEDLEEMSSNGEELFGAIALTVAASVVLHGASAAPAARRYGRWAAESAMSDDERSDMAMTEAESADHRLPRPRWARSHER